MAFSPPPALLTNILDIMAEGLVVLDPRGIIRMVNPALEEITGYRAEELLGQSCAPIRCPECFQANQPDSRERCRLFTEGDFPPLRCVVPQKDGSLRPVLKQGVLLKNDKGRVVAGLELFLDISELVQKERLLATIRRQLKEEEGFYGLLGRSPVMLELFSLIRRVAQSEAPILIEGESGSGKESVARLLHRLGPWAQGPLVTIHCRTLPPPLLEEEFSRVFSPGDSPSPPGSPRPNSGVDLFLKEVGALPLPLQARLLGLLEEKARRKRAGQHAPGMKVRLMAGTSQDLAQLIAEGRFLRELFYRLNVIPLRVPPLRERREDIPLLAAAFLERAAFRARKTITGFSPEVLELLMRYSWPGNVRELLNVVDYGVILCPGGLLLPEHLPGPVREQSPQTRGQGALRRNSRRLRDPETLRKALADSGGKVTAAAQLLGVSRVTLWKWLKKYKMAGEKGRRQG